MAGAVLAFPLRPADAHPDPIPEAPGLSFHDCNTGFFYDDEFFDEGPVSDPFHHNVEPLLAPLLEKPIPVPFGLPPTEIGLDPHDDLSCQFLFKMLHL